MTLVLLSILIRKILRSAGLLKHYRFGFIFIRRNYNQNSQIGRIEKLTTREHWNRKDSERRDY